MNGAIAATRPTANVWRTAKLGDVLDVQNGYAFPSKKFSETEGAPLIRIRDLKAGNVTSVGYVGDYDEAYVVHNGDLLIGMDGDFVCHEWSGGNALLNQRVCRLRDFSDDAEPRFIFYGINKFLKEIQDSTTFTTVKHLSSKKIKAIDFPLPPLDEQKRIVAVLDQAFAALDRARVHIEANLADAEALFVESLRSRFAVALRMHGAIALDQLSEHITDGDHQAPPKAETGVPFITISNINKSSRTLNFSKTFYVPREYYEKLSPKKRPKYGDILYSVTGSFGIPVLVKDYPDFCFQRHIGLIRPRRTIDSDWLYFMLMSPQCLEQADAGATGTAQRTVSLKTLRSLKAPNTPQADQSAEVESLSRLYRICSERITQHEKKLADLAELRRSLLEKAFAGELAN